METLAAGGETAVALSPHMEMYLKAVLVLEEREGVVRSKDLADELLEGILRELVEIHVTGTLAKPRFRTIPLRSLDAILKKLLRPE